MNLFTLLYFCVIILLLLSFAHREQGEYRYMQIYEYSYSYSKGELINLNGMFSILLLLFYCVEFFLSAAEVAVVENFLRC